MKHWYDEHEEKMSWGDQLSDSLVQKIGSINSVSFHSGVFMGFFAGVPLGFWDVSTMLLVLTTVVSLEAIYLCLFMQNSINRAGDRDRVQAQHDYAVNIEAERRIEALQRHLHEIDTEKLDIILKLLSTPPRKTVRKRV